MDLRIGSIYTSTVEAPVIAEVDVLVAGGGTAGCAAAIAAARNGARVLVVERSGYLGGMMTEGHAALTIFIGYPGGRVRENRQWRVGQAVERFADAVRRLREDPSEVLIAGGIPLDLAKKLMEAGAGIGIGGVAGTYVTTDSEAFKALLFAEMEQAGVQLLLHSWLTDVIKDEDRLVGVVVESKSGRQALLARYIVDASGDADVAFKAGAPCHVGVTQGDISAEAGVPLGTTEEMGIMYTYANVDVERVFQFARERDDWEPTWPAFQELENAYQDYREGHMAQIYLPQQGVEFFTMPTPGFVLTYGCGTPTSGLSAADLTRAEVAARKTLTKQLAHLRKHVPGFENAKLASVPEMSVRETRRIVGEYVLTLDDVLESREFEDGIGRGGHPIDISVSKETERITERSWHKPPNWSFSIPYRTLVPQRVKGLLAAGRCISATHEAFGCTRATVQCMITGQAAGTAAALSVKEGVDPHLLDTNVLRTHLAGQGVVL